MPARRQAQSSIHQLKVAIKHIRPPVWRRLQVRRDVTLATLHDIVQAAFGWTDSHLHQFVIGDAYYGVPDPEGDVWGGRTNEERKTRLDDVVGGGVKRFAYEYDFGDGWEHEIIVEKVLSPEAGVSYPRCVAGRRACPPEDCGGPWGYAELLAALGDPGHPEHEEMLDWAGGDFDPEAFDLQAVNMLLRA